MTASENNLYLTKERIAGLVKAAVDLFRKHQAGAAFVIWDGVNLQNKMSAASYSSANRAEYYMYLKRGADGACQAVEIV